MNLSNARVPHFLAPIMIACGKRFSVVFVVIVDVVVVIVVVELGEFVDDSH